MKVLSLVLICLIFLGSFSLGSQKYYELPIKAISSSHADNNGDNSENENHDYENEKEEDDRDEDNKTDNDDSDNSDDNS